MSTKFQVKRITNVLFCINIIDLHFRNILIKGSCKVVLQEPKLCANRPTWTRAPTLLGLQQKGPVRFRKKTSIRVVKFGWAWARWYVEFRNRG